MEEPTCTSSNINRAEGRKGRVSTEVGQLQRADTKDILCWRAKCSVNLYYLLL